MNNKDPIVSSVYRPPSVRRQEAIGRASSPLPLDTLVALLSEVSEDSSRVATALDRLTEYVDASEPERIDALCRAIEPSMFRRCVSQTLIGAMRIAGHRSEASEDFERRFREAEKGRKR